MTCLLVEIATNMYNLAPSKQIFTRTVKTVESRLQPKLCTLGTTEQANGVGVRKNTPGRGGTGGTGHAQQRMQCGMISVLGTKRGLVDMRMDWRMMVWRG